MRIEWVRTEIGECERFEDVPKGARVVGIDDKNVVAKCDACERWITEGESYVSMEDAYLCRKCADEYAKAEGENE